VTSVGERLAAAVEHGEVDAVRAGLDAGADPNDVDEWGVSLLQLAVECGHAEVTRVLLTAGADPHTRTDAGDTILMHAVHERHEPTIRVLVQFGADPDGLDSALRSSVASCAKAPLTEVLLEVGADVHGHDPNGWTCLHLAAAYGYEASTRLLLQFGADPSSRTTTGLTPADLAAVNGHGDLAEELRRATGRGSGHN
jgi:uncharacterized protein